MIKVNPVRSKEVVKLADIKVGNYFYDIQNKKYYLKLTHKLYDIDGFSFSDKESECFEMGNKVTCFLRNDLSVNLVDLDIYIVWP